MVRANRTGANQPIDPLPAPGNGDPLETPLSRLTPNVGENRLDFMPGTSPQHACATSLG